MQMKQKQCLKILSALPQRCVLESFLLPSHSHHGMSNSLSVLLKKDATESHPFRKPPCLHGGGTCQ